MNILLTGANGMLGKSIEYWIFKNFPNVKLYSTDIKNLDITNYEQLSIFFDNHPIDIVINCAAYANVDGCEQNPEIAYSVNAAAVGYLAKLTEKYSKKICHISTDYVYAQTGENMPFTEESKLEPLSIYGKSKLLGEKKLMENTDKYFILRTSWMFGFFGENFLKWIYYSSSDKPLRLIIDSFGNPTYSITLSEIIMKIIFTENYGIYNASNFGYTNWYDFGKYILSSAGLTNHKIEKVQSAELKRPAQRPNYSVMNINKIIKTLNYTPPSWQEAVDSCVKILKQKNEF